MDLVLVGAIAAAVAVFSLLMALFEPWLFPPQPKLDAVRASEQRFRLIVHSRKKPIKSVKMDVFVYA